ncbi:hypothetical protein [Arthrobacter sp. 31Y]|uniref:hypothetical protein n=1 Tax=Arthrobacter sp. 31Y TaxID=1115632 RepID=UPI000466451F|nr:hypothetical protein [Arthrobacter sp. 31Y]
MSTVTITVDINGQQHDIADCFWYFLSPCGCTSGVCVTEADGWLTTEAQAMAFMTPNRAVREQDIARGYRAELGHRSEMDRLKRECPHTPQWGTVAVPEGQAWGRSSGGRSVHLVEKSEDEDRIDWDYREPACGSKRDLFEIHSSVLGDAPMCKKCLAILEAA